ncbi:unnamed protein product [Mytilus coruscus]|uniref:C2H2-type domain-containing protein n=1 Tax=Mytilus coruscus TaxID=42192 RepID=A0A6J8CV64_MYTCO|nr:unnamed protein product [Mytilus coruscus]
MYTCLICYKEYKYEKNLIRHIKEHHDGLESYDCTEDNCSSTFIRRGYLFNHLTTIHGIEEELARCKSLSAERRSSSNNEQYYDDVSKDDTILDLINDAIETEKQKVVPSMSVEEFLDSLDNISDDEINDCTATDEHEEECENTSKDVDSCGTSDEVRLHSSYDNISDCCKSDDQSNSDINNNTNDIIIVSDDDDDDINDERSLMTIGN